MQDWANTRGHPMSQLEDDGNQPQDVVTSNASGNGEQQETSQAQSAALESQQAEQLAILDKSLFYVRSIMAALMLNYYVITQQRNGLLGLPIDGCNGELFPLQFTASTIILKSVSYFYQLSAMPAADLQDESAICSANINSWASLLVLIAAGLRYYDLIRIECCEPKQTQEEKEEQIGPYPD